MAKKKTEQTARITFEGSHGAATVIDITSVTPEGKVEFEIMVNPLAKPEEFDNFHSAMARMFIEILRDAQVVIVDKSEMPAEEAKDIIAMTQVMGGPIGEA